VRHAASANVERVSIESVVGTVNAAAQGLVSEKVQRAGTVRLSESIVESKHNGAFSRQGTAGCGAVRQAETKWGRRLVKVVGREFILEFNLGARNHTCKIAAISAP
jgi:hypothetical protein